jgi:heme-degrading monooxygenase HmoA
MGNGGIEETGSCRSIAAGTAPAVFFRPGRDSPSAAPPALRPDPGACAERLKPVREPGIPILEAGLYRWVRNTGFIGAIFDLRKGRIMITVGMDYRVVAGKEHTFENAFKGVLKVMQDMPGHAGSKLYRDVEDGRSYLIVSEWNDRQAFDAFVGSEKFRQVTNWGKEQILSQRPVHTVYEK